MKTATKTKKIETVEIKTFTVSPEQFRRFTENEGICKFLKKDGSVRRMRFTTKLEEIPGENHPKGTGHKSAILSTIRVFDLDKQEWRSIDLTRMLFIGDEEEEAKSNS